MKKKILIISTICIILITTIIVGWLLFFQKTDIVEEKENKNVLEPTIKNFENAFNNYEFDGMIECIHPTYRETIKVAGDLLSLFVSKPKWNISFVFNLAKIGIPLIPYISNLNITSDDLPHLVLNITDYEIDGDNAECSVSGILTAGDFTKDFEYIVILEKVDDIWYIVKTK